jgi:hypothetical protein
VVQCIGPNVEKQGGIQACPFLRLSFLRKSKLVARKEGRYAEKASAQLFRIADCGLRIADFGFRIFLVFFFNPHSAIHIPHFGGGPIGRYRIRNFYFFFSNPHSAIGIPHFNCPPGPRNERCLMIFSRRALTSGPGNA